MGDSLEEDAEGGTFGALLLGVASTPLLRAPLLAGQRLDDFVIEAQLGAGGAGFVYLATDVHLGRKVALKLQHVRGTAETRLRASREAAAMARLQHPNVVAVYRVGQASADQLYIAMEYVEGSDARQWQHERPRGAAEILELYLQAGRGLAAAHHAGLIHRDVKPENVLVGRDGRARMADFGLATESGDLLAEGTGEGAFAGTPAYASPEQWARRPLDARSDQYSFAVSLYEALYGALPFAARTVEALEREQAGHGAPVAGRPGRGLAVGIRRVLARALSASPDRRYPRMDELLAELAGVRRRRRWAMAAALLATVAGALGGAFGPLARRPCADVGPLAAAWSDGPRASVEARLADAGLSRETAGRVVQGLDQYVAGWARVRREVCLATAVERSRSDELLDRSMRCLDQRALAVGALLRVLERAEPESSLRAQRAVYDLPPPEDCADLQRLSVELPPPGTASLAREVEVVRSMLAESRAEETGGSLSRALELARSASAAAPAGYPPLGAEVRYQLGRAEQALGAYGASAAELEEAYFAARGAGHDVLAVEAASALIYLESFHRADHARALEWGRHARAEVQRLGAGGRLLGAVLLNQGSALEGHGDFAPAVEQTREAVEVLRAALGPRHPDVATALTRHGSALEALGDRRRAVVVLEEAVSIVEERFGREHRELHRPLAELGQALSPLGETARAVKVQERALAICRSSFGQEHVNTGFAELNLGVALHWAGRVDEARAHYRRAAAIVEARLGPDHRDTALCLTNLALTLDRDRAEAAALHRRVIAIFARQGERTADMARARINLAYVLHEDGQHAAALAEAEQAAEIWQALTPGGPNLAFALQLVGMSRHALGRSRAAVDPLERAVEIRSAAGFAASFLADSELELAKALWAAGADRVRAVALAEAALGRYRALGEDGASRVADAEGWLRSRRRAR